MRMLAEWGGGFAEADMEAEGADVEIGSAAKQGQKTNRDIAHSTTMLRAFFNGKEEHIPCFREMDSREWAVAFSRMDSTNALTCEHVLRLLCGVHQPGLAEFIVFTIVPFLMMGNDQRGLMDLLTTAVEKAGVRSMEMKKVRGLLQLYRGLEVGVLGAMAQLTIVKSITTPR